MLCSRRSHDPLLRLFMKDRVNLLAMPRRELPLGTVFAVEKDLVESLPAADVLDGQLAVEELPNDPDAVEAVSRTVTSDLALDMSASFLGTVLAAVGLGSEEAKLSAKLGGKGVHMTSFKLLGLAIRRARLVPLAHSLQGCSRKDLPLPLTDRTELYVCTGTWAAKGVEMRTKLENGQVVEAAADLKSVVEAGAKLDIKKGYGTETLITASERVVFGVEVMRLGPGKAGLELADVQPQRMLRGDQPKHDPAELAILDGGGEDAFLRIGAA